jgi:hypothetical protein
MGETLHLVIQCLMHDSPDSKLLADNPVSIR